MSSIYFYEFDLSRYYLINNQALLLARKYKVIREEGYCCYNLALYFMKIGNYYKSFLFLNRSFEISVFLNDIEDEIDCLYAIGFIFCELGNYEYSLKYLNKALLIIGNNNKRIELLNTIGIAIKRIADELNDNTKYFEAKSCYRKALNLASANKENSLEAVILNNIGSCYLAQKKYINALFYLNESIKRIDTIVGLDVKSVILTNIGTINYELKQYEKAKEYFKKAIKLLKNKNVPNIWEAYYGLGRCYEENNLINNSLYYYKKAIVMIDKVDINIKSDIDKANYLKNKFKAYESLIKVLFLEIMKNNNNQGLKNDLLFYIEKSRAKYLNEQYNNKNKTDLIYRTIMLDQFYCDKNCKQNKINVKQDISPFNINGKEEHNADSLLSITSDNNCQFKNKDSNIYNYIKERIDNKTSILMYSVGEEISILVVISKDEISFYELPCREKIEKSIQAYLRIITSATGDIFQGKKAAARILREIFFPILTNKLKDIKKIIVIPDGLLYYLPFEALAIENNNDNSGMFVIEKYDVSYSPSLLSIGVLAQKAKIRKNDISCLIIGDPDYLSFRRRSKNQYLNALIKKYECDGLYLNPLPYTKEEALAIKNVINSNRITMYLDNKACEENIKQNNLKNYDIIHFACHGFYDEEVPTRSGLILSINPASKEDGLLQVGEIYDLDLDAGLVVLSACQTARGQIARGEGILGLTRTFFYSGAKTVVSTLWNIDDISTVVFMKYFYTYLSEGMGKSEALRSAKIKMINSQYSHPFYWAAFVLNGDYKSKIAVH